MSTSRENAVWGRIRTEFKRAQELILNGQYAEAMIQTRELLRFLVSMQMDRACLVSTNLREDIDKLQSSRLIDQQMRDAYQYIAYMGDQAQAGQTGTAQDANQSLLLLKDALEAYVEQLRGAQTSPAREETAETAATARADELRAQREARTVRNTAARSSAGRSTAARRAGSARRGGREVQANVYDILKFAIPIACILLVILIIRLAMPGKKADTGATSTAAVSTEAMTMEPVQTTEAVTTAPETSAAAELSTYVTTSNVNLRTAPSTGDDARVLAVLQNGTEIKVKGDHNSEWAIVDYNGQDAYINKNYIRAKT